MCGFLIVWKNNGGALTRIDLHCHTKQIKSGDGEKRNVTPEVFREKIMNAEVGIVAITNHNAFDYEQLLHMVD